jgi:putative glutamine amidotransferase
MTGGADVDPGRYREPAHPLAQPARPDRDHTELALVRAAIEADLPLLGICRGMQVMAVAEGGRLEQHLPDRLGHATCTAPRRAGTAASECAPRKVHGCARPWANG